jgi:hypothetical protein
MTEGSISLKTFYVSAPIPDTDCHVTLAFRANCTPEDRDELVKAAELHFDSHFPLEVEKAPGGLIAVGKKKELEAVKIIVVDQKTRIALKAFWDIYQRRKSGQQMFPFNLHATLKTPARKEQMKALPERFALTRVVVKELETKGIVWDSDQ